MKLYDSGVYLVNGTELVVDDAQAAAAIKSRTGREVTKAEAAQLPLRKALAIEKDITIVCVGAVENLSDCVACCGTHPSTTGQVGLIKIYKVEKYLNKCIDSILKQTFQDFELILVDDGSPDKCPKICDEYAKKDKRVRVIHKENAGLVAARNTGIKEAKGDYICYVDGDDWISENLLQIV